MISVLAPYQYPLLYGWIDIEPSISGTRAKEWVSEWEKIEIGYCCQWPWLSFSFNSFALALPFSFTLFLFLSLAAPKQEWSMLYTRDIRKSLLCLCMWESCECIASTLNIARVHLVELYSVVLCTSNTTTGTRTHIYLSLTIRQRATTNDKRYCFVDGDNKFIKLSSIDFQICGDLELIV